MTRSRPTYPWRLGLRAAGALLLTCALALPAFAQRLPDYLPADTVLALGVVDLASHADALDGVLADWERFGVGAALQRAFGDVDPGMLGVPLDDADMDGLELPAGLEDLEVLDLLGREAWVGVSVSPFNPLPSVTLLALVDEATGARFDAVLAATATEPGAQTLREGDASIVAVIVDGLPIAGARYGELLALSTNPDALRGVLRAAQGGSDPSFADSAGYIGTLGTMAPGQLYGFLDLEPLARALTPLAGGLGFDRSVARIAAMLETFGTSAGVARVTSRGSESESVQLLRAGGRDPALYALLAADVGGVPPRLIDAIPAEAVSVSATAGDPGAIYDYLITLLRELPELALPDPEGLIRDLIGVDLRGDVFAWMGNGSMTVTTGFGAAVDPGVPGEDLLGESALVFLSDDDAAARAGLERTGVMLASMVSAFADPMGAGGMVQPATRDVAGVAVTSFDVFPGLELHVAAANGYALVATSAGAADAVARAIGGGGALPETIARLLPEVPAEASSFTVSDDRATLIGTADQLTMQVQLLAGLSGGAGLDFDAVEDATAALEGFLQALAQRLGGTVSYSVSDGAALRGVSRSEIDWR
jgi:hypothetical protein